MTPDLLCREPMSLEQCGDKRYSPPRPGRIDLGQPLFRREVLDPFLHGVLPFQEVGWDWRMIEPLIQNGVRWRHVNRATFIFRLERYLHLLEQIT